ncbi:MAG: DUF4256 domain-containing protein [Candidatus Shapirobacteria bacterium]
MKKNNAKEGKKISSSNFHNHKKLLLPDESQKLLDILQARFKTFPNRHPDLVWEKVLAKLEANLDKLLPLYEMEQSGGQPDVVGFNPGELIFYDCSPESPTERRNLCYDRQALESRKANKPRGNALDMAAIMGIEILTEDQYRQLQSLGVFDTKTSSWIKTPESIRKLGGAIFADRRYNHVFIYHNGAESYYGSRGFRGALKV